MAKRRSTRGEPHTVVPVNLRWISGSPPESKRAEARRTSFQHEVVAAMLKGRPEVWAELPDFNGEMVSAICHGKYRAYRPGGSFQSVTRNGRVYVRYVGVLDA